jgi:Raf kinase inhibitor-like YbhB/YbcL family protein
MVNLKLTSSAFSDGGEIPREYGYKNGNREPQLTISGTPDGTKSLALIMDDPDAMGAVGKVWVHWVMWNIPLHALYPNDGSLMPGGSYRLDMGIMEGMTDFGEVGYGGPAPPDKRHTYVFKLYALDSELDLPDKSTKADVEKAMEGHIIEQTQLTGTYAP